MIVFHVCVPFLRVAELSNLKITKCRQREMPGMLPFDAIRQIPQYVNAPPLVFRTEKAVQQEKLTNHVAQVQHFHQQIQDADVDPGSFSTRQYPSNRVPIDAEIPLKIQRPLNVQGDVFDTFRKRFGVDVFCVDRQRNDLLNVDSCKQKTFWCKTAEQIINQ